MDTEGAKAEDYAVLARTNAELNDFETACIINEIPYIRKGGKGSLEAPESKAVLGYLDLATGNDFEKKKSSLIAALTKPDRNLFLGAEALETAVDEAIDDVARSERIDKRFVDPASLLESKYVRILADRLKQPYRLQVISRAKNPETGAWVYGKRVDELADNLRGLRSDVDALRRTIDARNPGSEELINFVLDNMSSTVSGWDRATNRNFTAKTTLREQITGDVAVFSDDDGDEVEEEAPKGEVGEEGQMALDEKKKAAEQKGLGAVQFLFALAQPNANDQTHNTDPSTAQGLVRKLARYSALADTLRIDPDKFAKEQERIADQGQRREKPPAVTLSTVHSVKGAEWPNVSVLMPAKVFPSEPKARPDEPPPDPVEVAANLRAERNLAYVALTRAAHNLEILCPANKGVSRFVREAGLVVGENVTKETSASEGATKTASDFDLHHVDESLEMYGQEASAPTYSYARSTS
jgi:superfamily I DNA/RNA helicase